MTSGSPKVRILTPDADRPLLPLVIGEGEARAVVWPGVGAKFRSLHHITLGAGATTVPQRHPGEAVYHVTTGTVDVEDLDEGVVAPLRQGSMVHVEPGTAYRFLAGRDGAELVGGPSPADPSLYETLVSATPDLKEA